MLRICQIEKSYKKRKILNGISFNLKKGEVVSYLGNNGSGKTTTFRIIVGLSQPDEGQILFDDRRLKLREIAYLSEERSLFTDCTVYQQLKLICNLNKLDENAILKYLAEYKMEQYLNTKIYKLSKGNQQKIALIAAVIKNPTVIVLDEPFTGLDESNVELFKKEILKLKFKNKIILVSSHIYQPINDICDRYIYLEGGKIVLNITKQELLSNPKCIVELKTNNEYLFNLKKLRGDKYIFDNYKQAKCLLKHLKYETPFVIRKLNIPDCIEAYNENFSLL